MRKIITNTNSAPKRTSTIQTRLVTFESTPQSFTNLKTRP